MDIVKTYVKELINSDLNKHKLRLEEIENKLQECKDKEFFKTIPYWEKLKKECQDKIDVSVKALNEIKL